MTPRRTCARYTLALLAALVTADVALADPRPAWRAEAAEAFAPFIAEAAARHSLPAAWIAAVLRAESGGDARAVSPAGAMGLMQLMPETWSDLRQRLALGADPFDPRDNILAGAGYLRELLDRYGPTGFLAAYNAGPGRYEAHLRGDRALPAETLAYLATVGPQLGAAGDGSAPPDPLAWRRAALFPAGGSPATDAPPIAVAGSVAPPPTRHPSAAPSASGGLFVRRSGPRAGVSP
ncbi:lytic transglycosylase domain-containing protein [Phenylobacterium sp.]|uniref:lytic transglycosylase domain-containing protein n=1 Tax=Phenylobacterium sp. TaxID=1871053 RepID=UPI00289C93CE|nr:lytic transglycosylase domain-containing protein [Phenylobacterium sp.]